MNKVHMVLADYDLGEQWWCTNKQTYTERAMSVSMDQMHKVDCPDCLYAAFQFGKKAEEYWYALP